MKSERRTLLICSDSNKDIADAVSASSVEGVLGLCLLQDMSADASSLGELPASLQTRTMIKPRERYRRSVSVKDVRAQEKAAESTAVPALMNQLSSFVARLRANDLWFVLDGPTSVRLAHLALTAGVRTVRVQIPEPPSDWLKAMNVDQRTACELLAKHDELIVRAADVGVGSWSLAADCRTRLGRDPDVILPWLDTTLARAPALRSSADVLRVALVGMSAASPEFFSLVEAMIGLKSDRGWGTVELHVFVDAASIPVRREGSLIRIRKAGEGDALIDDLSQMDLLFLSTPFRESAIGEERQILARLAVYLASGRPVLFHGPSDSALGRLLRESAAAFFCFREGADAVRAAIVRNLHQERLYAEIAEGGRKLLEGRFSMQAQGHAIHAFVGRSPKPDVPRHGDAQMRDAPARLETAP